MILKTSDGASVAEPTPDQIRAAIMHRRDTESVTLEDDRGHALRLRDEMMFGPIVEHFEQPNQQSSTRAARGLSMDQTIAVFQRFAAAEPNWDSDLRIQVRRGCGCLTVAGVFLFTLYFIA